MRARIHAFLLLLLTTLATHPTARADDSFFLHGGEKIIFFGDSITQGGHYVTYVEAYLLTRFPEKSFTVINHGISSETVSGTSESDHSPRRPNALDRFERDVLNYHPDVLCACFGMNDGIYAPFDPDRFALYQKGMRTLIDGVQNLDNARIAILTPPPFDPYRRKAGDRDAVHFGYKYPYLQYDDVLTRYAQWLRSLRGEDITVADVHSLMATHLRRRREQKVSYYLSGDAVHPNETGHWLMAEALLLEWHAPALADEAVIDAANQKAVSGQIQNLSTANGRVRFSWTSKIPMPLSPRWDRESLDLERVSDRLNRYRLKITGLPPASYQLWAADEGQMLEKIASLSADQLAEGADLTSFETFPTVKASLDILTRLESRNREIYQAWRKAIASGENRPLEPRPDPKLQKLCQPRVIQIELRRDSSTR